VAAAAGAAAVVDSVAAAPREAGEDMNSKQNLLTDDELKSLSAAITQVERGTSGELRLIIAQRSSRTSHVFPLLTLILASLSLIYLWTARHLLMLGDTTWTLPAVLIGASGLGYLFSRFPSVQRRLTWTSDLEHQALMRAELEFYREGLGATVDKTGILIFLSVFDHQAVVLADKGIAAKIDSKVWSEVVAMVLEGVRKKRLRENLEKAIQLCGELLNKEFPIKAGDKNELPNHVLVKD
jgi:putative membrane protein